MRSEKEMRNVIAPTPENDSIKVRVRVSVRVNNVRVKVRVNEPEITMPQFTNANSPNPKSTYILQKCSKLSKVETIM